MSTFNGLVDEFPEIRVDYFRPHPGSCPPSACFLSHVHSDHLQGLESLKMPFVYCSAATRKILLKMEKYPHRINFAKGILEARKQTYKRLKTVLRALPLQTPVDLEPSPRCKIRVTLFDSNHCPGAVMFLIEGSGKAILYTGDVRAEPWWVNSIVRNPVLLPYSSGLRQLDCIYLDTTFASHSDIYRNFPTKAEGLNELMRKVDDCTGDTVFYFRAWTFGYEDVWLSLSNLLRSKVHVDNYQLRLFRSLVDDGDVPDHSNFLVRYRVGNQDHDGCLTSERQCRIHSCEPGMPCHAALSTDPKVMWVTPIISRLEDGTEVAEVGAGGGGGDLYQTSELDMGEDTALDALESLCRQLINDSGELSRVQDRILDARQQGSLKFSLDDLSLDHENEIPLRNFIRMLSERHQMPNKSSSSPPHIPSRYNQQNTIHFPYSRHSSYSELRDLVSAFKPRDICPCTVEPDNWSEELSMKSLFGDLCSTEVFVHDQATRDMVREKRLRSQATATLKRKRENESQNTDSHGDADTSEEYYSAGPSISTSSVPVEQAKAGVPLMALHSQSQLEGMSSEQGMKGAESNGSFIGFNELETEWRNLNRGSNTYCPPPEVNELEKSTRGFCDSPVSASPSDFDPEDYDHLILSQVHGDEDDGTSHNEHADRVGNRRIAYLRAKRCLSRGENSAWDALHLRSMGWTGHSEEEVIL